MRVDNEGRKQFQTFRQEDLEGVEEHIHITNNALDQLYELENPDDMPMILKTEHEEDDMGIPLQSDKEQEGEYSMPDEHQVRMRNKDGAEDRDATEKNFSNDEKQHAFDTELESLAARNEGDDADSGDNTEDLDPRSEFDKRKEYNERLCQQINSHLSDLDKLRQQLIVLEDEEFRLYSAKRTSATDLDPAELKLEYRKSLCKNVIIKEKMLEIAKLFAETDKQIHAKTKENRKFEKALGKIDKKIEKLKSSLIKKLSAQINSEFEAAKNRRGELEIIISESQEKLNRINRK